MASIFDIFDHYKMDYVPAKYEPEDEYHFCAACHSNRVKDDGDLCQTCEGDKARGYAILTLAGRCANGAERDHGTRWHAVPGGSYKALCGAEPGKRSAGWSSWRVEGQAVTCPRCTKKLEG